MVVAVMLWQAKVLSKVIGRRKLLLMRERAFRTMRISRCRGRAECDGDSVASSPLCRGWVAACALYIFDSFPAAYLWIKIMMHQIKTRKYCGSILHYVHVEWRINPSAGLCKRVSTLILKVVKTIFPWNRRAKRRLSGAEDEEEL